MTRIVALVVALLAAAVALYFATTKLPATSVVEEEEPTLRLRLESFSLGLDPASILDTQSRRVIDMLHARLLSEDQRGVLHGELAGTWEWTDPRTLKLSLKSGMQFSDGRPVRARDAAWSICRQVQPAAAFVWLFSNIEHRKVDEKTTSCTGIQAEGDSILSIRITHSPARLLHALASSMGAVVPEGSKPGEYGSMIGAGPFRIERIESNAAVHLVASYGGPIKAGVARAVLRYVPDDATATAQFKAGQLDVLEIANPRILRMAKETLSKPGVRVVTSDAHQVRLLVVNLDRLQHARGWSEAQAFEFMEALRNSLTQAKLEEVYGQLGRQVASAYFPARRLGAIAQDAPSRRDAQDVNSTILQMISENDLYSEQIAASLPETVVQLKIEFVGLDKSILLDRLVAKDYDIAIMSLEALVADPVYWASFFKPGSPFNLFGRPIKALASVEPNTENIAQIAKLVDQQGNWIVLFQERRQYLFQPGVRNERILPTGLIDFGPMTKEQ